MEVVTNQKGGRTLLLDGFAYTVERERNGKIYWRCEKRDICHARLTTAGPQIIMQPVITITYLQVL